MEKMELSEALKANASVLEGLLPLATNETKGLASMNMLYSIRWRRACYLH